MNKIDQLKESVEGFEEINYRQVMVERNQDAYRITEEFVRGEVSRLVEMYKNLTVLDQRARLIRDGIDLYLRRGHGYTIEGSIGSHYREVGVDLANCIFEHMIPQSHFFDRYTGVFSAQYETFNGQAIADPHTWTLGKHYEFFGVNK